MQYTLQLQITVTYHSVFIPWSALTHKERALEIPSCWCLFHTIQDTFQFSHWIYSKKPMSYSYKITRAFGRCHKCPVQLLNTGLFFIGGKIKLGLLLCKIHRGPLTENHPTPGIFSRLPAYITASFKKVEARKGKKIAWPQLWKNWRQRHGKDKGKRYRNRI